MRLAAHSRIIGALALALTATAFAPGTSAAYRLTQQEYARMIAASHQSASPGTSAGGSLTQQEIARLAQLSRQHPNSVAQAPVLRPKSEQQVQPGGTPGADPVQGSPYIGVNRAKEAYDAERAAAASGGVASSGAGAQTQPLPLPGRHGLAQRYPIAPGANSTEPTDGFDVGDAAVGAGIAAAIVLLATAVTLTVRRRHQPQHG